MLYLKFVLAFLLVLPVLSFAAAPTGVAREYIAQGVPSSEITLTAEDRAFLESHDLRCAMPPNWPPVNMYDQHEKLVGIAIDYWALISSKLNIDVECEVKASLSEVMQAIEARQTDFMLATSMADERKRYAVFSKSYASFPIAIATTLDKNYMSDESALLGKRVAVGHGYSAYRILKKENPDLEFVEVDNTRVGLELLADNKVFAVVDNLPVLQRLIKESKHSNIKIAGTTKHTIDLRLMLRSDYPQLAVIVNKAIDLISEQDHNRIMSRWLDYDAINNQFIDFTRAEQVWLRQNHTVRVRMINWPPYMIVKNGQPPQGISIDYLKLIGKRTGINFQYELTDQPFAEFLDSMKQGQGPDLTSVIMPTPQRQAYLSFSNHYLASPYVIIVSEQREMIKSISGLGGKILAVPRGTAMQKRMAADHPEVVQKLFDSDEQALLAVATGRADAYIGNLTLASHIIHLRGLADLRVVPSDPYGDQLLSMGARSDWPELISIINKVLANISEEEKTAIRRKYVAVHYVAPGISSADVFKYILIFSVVVLAIVVLFFVWNRTLQKKIRQRTAALEKEIGDRKKAQELRGESEQRFRATFEQAAVGVAHVAPDGRFLRINQKFCEITGYSQEEMLALTFQDITYPKDLEKDLSLVQELLSGKRNNYSMEKRYIRKDAAITWVNLTASVIRKDNGEVDWFVSVIEDISQRKRAEKALRKSEKNLLNAQEMAHMGNWEWDIRNNRITWSDEVYRIYGIEPGTRITYERLKQAIHPEDQEYHDTHTAEWLNSHGGEPFEYRVIRPDGFIRHVYATGEVQCDDAGEPLRLMGVVQDISERKQAEGLLRYSEERLRRLIEQSPVSIQIHALDGKLIQHNAAFARLYSLSEQTLAELYEKYNVREDEQARALGLMPFIEKVYHGENVTFPDYEYNGIDTLKTLNFNNPVSRKCWMRTQGFALKDECGKITSVVFMSEDITDKVLAEQVVLHYQDRLQGLSAELTRTEERERRKIATELHDHVGQSLAVMRIQLATAIKEADGRRLESILHEVSSSLRQAVADTRNIITDLSSPTLNELGLAAAIVEFLKEHIENRYGLQVQFNEDAKSIRLSDSAKAILYRSVRELLMNVVKHASAHSVSVSITRNQSRLQIVVEDDGIGLVSGDLSRREINEGGFGLFSIEERMKDIGGSLSIEQGPDNGLRATLITPLDIA